VEEEGSNIESRPLESEIYAHETMYLLREPIIRAAIRKLDLPVGSHGLDAGCAIGLITQLLASAISPGGQVTGLDLSSQYLDYARARINELNLPQGIAFRKGDVNQLPFDDGSFDWAWSMDTLWPGPKEMGCPSEDPFSMVRELARVVKPGGTLAILFWTSQKLLPGYPLLEARLSTTSQATAPFRPGMTPDQHVLRGLAWLREVDLVDLEAHTFVANVVAPLDGRIRDALIFTFPMFWGGVEQEVSKEDWAEYNRLCQPESPDFIVDDPDYYAFHTYTMFQGRVAR
jgi:demethylmenaquinone methyltransferase/2-methoxy-6-polyprenyl-1,4-benzoquinol methylase